MALYERHFSKFDKSVAQVLLTHADLANRQRYINAKHTFQALLELSIVPIVNENDTVAVEEMKFGDNDHLSALVATLLDADLLVILSDVEGVYDRDPRLFNDARLIPLIGDVKEAKGAINGVQPERFWHGRHRHQSRRRRRGRGRRDPDDYHERTQRWRRGESFRCRGAGRHFDLGRSESTDPPQALDRLYPEAGRRRCRRRGRARGGRAKGPELASVRPQGSSRRLWRRRMRALPGWPWVASSPAGW